MDSIDYVREFHEVFGHKVGVVPDLGSCRDQVLRVLLLSEELDELREALSAGCLVSVLDALVDLQYVLDGAFLTFGLQDMKMDAIREVHRSNMSKLGANGEVLRRESDGKILKGDGYSPPDLSKFFVGVNGE